jgi:histone H1/5
MADFIDAPPAPVEVSTPLVKSKVAKKAIATATKGKKIVFAASKTKSGNPPYAIMVTKAIMELKEKKGSSRLSIMKYLQGNYKVRSKSKFVL